jgi:putative transposase
MLLTYKFRLNPTRAQHAALNRILEDQRQLYNAALAERIDAYKRDNRLCQIEEDRLGLPEKSLKRRSISYVDQTNSLTKCRQEAGLDDVPAFLQHWTLKRLDDAYKAFFRRVKEAKDKAGFPRFRGKDFWHSFGFSQNGGFRLGGARPKIAFKGLPGYHQGHTAAGNLPGGIRIHCHRPFPAGDKR